MYSPLLVWDHMSLVTDNNRLWYLFRPFSLIILWNFVSQILLGSLTSTHQHGQLLACCVCILCSKLYRKNIHGVNKVILERMLDRYERHVTIDMVMGSNKSNSRPKLPNRLLIFLYQHEIIRMVCFYRDAYSGPANSNKATGFLI